METSPEYVAFRCETASEAVDLLFDILESCVARPKPPLEQWSADLEPLRARLTAARSRPAT